MLHFENVTSLLLLLLVAAAVLVGWLLVYKARHPYTRADLTKARKDSIARSLSVVSGKVGEQFAPFFPEFIAEFNPKDARFLGTPLDYVVFDGLDEGDVRRVVFVEVKTGKAPLVKRERSVRDAIEAGSVEFKMLRLPGEIEPAQEGIEVIEAPEAPPALQA